jgi:hypothetical protein
VHVCLLLLSVSSSLASCRRPRISLATVISNSVRGADGHNGTHSRSLVTATVLAPRSGTASVGYPFGALLLLRTPVVDTVSGRADTLGGPRTAGPAGRPVRETNAWPSQLKDPRCGRRVASAIDASIADHI